MISPTVSLAWDGHHTILVSVFEKFLEGCELVDCTIAAEGQKLNAHKEILSAFSPYFELLFREETENNPTVILSGINFKDIKTLVYFMYHGTLEVQENRIKDLIDVAECLKIKGLGGDYERKGSAKANKTTRLCKVLTASSGIPHKRTRKVQGEEAANSSQKADVNNTNDNHRSLPNQNSSDARNAHLILESSVQNKKQKFDVQNIPIERNVPLIPPHSTLSSIEINNDMSNVTIETILGVVENVMETVKNASSKMNLYDSDGNSFEHHGDSVLGLPSDLSVTSHNNHYEELSQAALHSQLFSRDLLASSVRNLDDLNTTLFCSSVDGTVSAVETQNLFMKSEPSAEDEIPIPEDNNLRLNNGECSETSLQAIGVPSISVDEMLVAQNDESGSECSVAGSRCAEELAPLREELPAVPVETEGRGNNKSAVGVLPGLVADRAEPPARRPATRLSLKTLSRSDVSGPSVSDSQMRSSSKGKQFQCQYCNSAFKRADLLKRHQRNIHFELIHYKCTECNYVSTSRNMLKKHKRTHSVLKPYKCTKCHFSARYNSSLINHMPIHGGIKPYKCNECDYATTQSSDLKRHMRIHSGIRPFKCNECDYAATTKSNLKVHQRIHSGIKPHKCRECDFATAHLGYLKKHLLIHSGIRPYKCNECDYAATQSSHLITHLRIHSGIRPYKCNECDFAAAQRNQLIKHLRIHSGIRPYKCNECDYAATQSGALKSHMRTQHGV